MSLAAVSPSPRVRVFSAAWVLPIETPPIAEGAVAVWESAGARTGTIAAVGRRQDVLAQFAGAEETRAEGALLPGLVNAHTHLELSVFAGRVPGGGGIVAWTRRVVATTARSQDDALMSARKAARDAIALGTVALGDVGNGVAGWRAMMDEGLGGVFFHELLGSRDARTGDALADAGAERDGALASRGSDAPPSVPVVAAPHAPYSASPELLRRIFAAAGAAGRATTIHLAEDAAEIELLRHGTGLWAVALTAMGIDPRERAPGKDPVEYLDTLGAFAAGSPPPLLVHMVHASPDDRRRAAAAGATVVLCPRSNRQIGGRLADVPALLDDGVRLALGTDSLASVDDLSLWAEMALLAEHFPAVAASTWLRAATLGGAAALGLTTCGTLAAERRPGLVDAVPARPLGTDPEAVLVHDPKPRIHWMAHA